MGMFGWFVGVGRNGGDEAQLERGFIDVNVVNLQKVLVLAPYRFGVEAEALIQVGVTGDLAGLRQVAGEHEESGIDAARALIEGTALRESA